jgi:CRISPR system Cascade subunit CasE
MWLTSIPFEHPHLQQARWRDRRWAHHKTMALFGDLGNNTQARTTGQVLFRIEPTVGTGRLLVQSAVRPEIDELTSRPLDDLFAALSTGTRVQFKLHANPVRTVNRTTPDGKIRTHRAQIDRDHLTAWLQGRLTGAITTEELTEPTIDYATMGRTPLFTATFRGHGTIEDPALLHKLLIEGVGRAKAYGCGLLSVIPAS